MGLSSPAIQALPGCVGSMRSHHEESTRARKTMRKNAGLPGSPSIHPSLYRHTLTLSHRTPCRHLGRGTEGRQVQPPSYLRSVIQTRKASRQRHSPKPTVERGAITQQQQSRGRRNRCQAGHSFMCAPWFILTFLIICPGACQKIKRESMSQQAAHHHFFLAAEGFLSCS